MVRRDFIVLGLGLGITGLGGPLQETREGKFEGDASQLIAAIGVYAIGGLQEKLNPLLLDIPLADLNRLSQKIETALSESKIQILTDQVENLSKDELISLVQSYFEAANKAQFRFQDARQEAIIATTDKGNARESLRKVAQNLETIQRYLSDAVSKARKQDHRGAVELIRLASRDLRSLPTGANFEQASLREINHELGRRASLLDELAQTLPKLYGPIASTEAAVAPRVDWNRVERAVDGCVSNANWFITLQVWALASIVLARPPANPADFTSEVEKRVVTVRPTPVFPSENLRMAFYKLVRQSAGYPN